MKAHIFLFIILFSSFTYANDPMDILNAHIAYYEKEYSGYLRTQYELNISELYWKKVKDLHFYGNGIMKASDKIVVEIENLRNNYYELKETQIIDDVEKVVLLRAISFDVAQKMRDLSEYRDSVFKIITGSQLTCNPKHLDTVTKQNNPELMYPIPQYAFNIDGAPKLDMNYYFGIQFNSGGTPGGDLPMRDPSLSDEQYLVTAGASYVLAGVVCGFTTKDPMTFALWQSGFAVAIGGAFSVYNGMAGSDEYVKQMEKMKNKYKALNQLIAKTHSSLREKSLEIVTAQCQKTIGLNSEKGFDILPGFLNTVVNYVHRDLESLQKVESDLRLDVANEEKRIAGQILSSAVFFERFENKIAKNFESQMEELFEYEQKLDQEALLYFKVPSSSYKALKQSSTLVKKMENLDLLWSDLMEGDLQFSASSEVKTINWEKIRESFESRLIKDNL